MINNEVHNINVTSVQYFECPKINLYEQNSWSKKDNISKIAKCHSIMEWAGVIATLLRIFVWKRDYSVA